MSDSQFPEHEKLMKISEESQAIGSFIENGPYTLCEWSEEMQEFQPVSERIVDILAEWFEIDLNRIEAEKRQMLEEIRAANGGA